MSLDLIVRARGLDWKCLGMANCGAEGGRCQCQREPIGQQRELSVAIPSDGARPLMGNPETPQLGPLLIDAARRKQQKGSAKMAQKQLYTAPIPRTIQGLCDALLDELDQLRAGTGNVTRACTVCKLARSINESLQTEIEFQRHQRALRSADPQAILPTESLCLGSPSR